jgi:hypothetical protein
MQNVSPGSTGPGGEENVKLHDAILTYAVAWAGSEMDLNVELEAALESLCDAVGVRLRRR